LNSLLNVFSLNILPILLIAGLGFAAQRILKLNPRHFSQIVFNIFTPAFVFRLLINTDIQIADLGRMAGFAASIIAMIGLLSWLLSKALKLPKSLASAFILTATFANTGNFGLSLNQFAFGNEALAYASLFFITGSSLTNSVGVAIAAFGRWDIRRALAGILRVPSIYAVILAIILRSANVELPLLISRPVELVGQAAVPCMLITLGMQIGNSNPPKRIGLLLGTILLRLVISPAFALCMAPLFGLTGAAYQAGVSEAGTPTAVLTSIIAMQFDTEPDFIANAILLTTLLSPLTLTPLIAYLLG
jgi:predicted permease